MEEKGECCRRRKSMKMSMPSIAVLFVLTTIAVASLIVVPVVAQPVEVRVTPESGYVEEGATFIATIDVDDVSALNSVSFELSFDSHVIRMKDVEDGEINGEKLPVMRNPNPIDEDTVIVAILLPIGEGVSGSGYLAEVEFDVEGEEGEESWINISGTLSKVKEDLGLEEIQANWIGAKIRIGEEEGGEEEEEEEDEEEVGEEVTPGSPNIMAWNPAEAVVSNIVGEPRTFNISVDQITDISWQINGTEVQTNESVTEAVYTNTSAVIGTWNVSAIATNTTTGLSDMYTWIWSVTLTAPVTPTPTTLAPGVTPTSEAETEVTPTPTLAPGVTPTPTTSKTSTPKPSVPGFEAIFTIAVLTLFLFVKKKTCAKRKKGDKRRRE